MSVHSEDLGYASDMLSIYSESARNLDAVVTLYCATPTMLDSAEDPAIQKLRYVDITKSTGMVCILRDDDIDEEPQLHIWVVPSLYKNAKAYLMNAYSDTHMHECDDMCWWLL